MGYGYLYRCASCGFKDEVLVGVGFGHTQEVGEIYRGFQLGAYGPRLRRVFRKSKLAGVSANYDVFVCESCGHWSTFVDASIWEPNDPDQAVAEAAQNNNPYWEWDNHPAFIDAEAWHPVCAYEPKCPKCSGKMHHLGLGDRYETDVVLPCPGCGEKNRLSDGLSMINWD